MAVPLIVADFESSLSTSITAGGTSFSLSSILDDDGITLPGGLYYFTLDNSSSAKEYLTGTLSGNTVTGVKSVSRQGVETSGAKLPHRVGAPVIITDFATYKKYIDGTTTAGAPTATPTTLGIARLATTAANASDPIVVGDNDPRLPPANGVQFLAGVTGMIIPYAGNAVPTGFLPCDGAEISRTVYAALFTAIGTGYGVGNGATTFNVPDGRGRGFIGAGTGTATCTFASRSGNAITVTGVPNYPNNSFQTGQMVTYVSTGTAIGGLTSGSQYYVIRTGTFSFSLALTLADAQNGVVIVLSSDGSGNQTFTITFTARSRGDTGGEENHAMSKQELLSHNHTLTPAPKASGGSGSSGASSNSYTTTPATDFTGGNQAMNIMSPFFVGTWIIKT